MRTVVIGLGLLMVAMFALVIAKLFSAMQGHETSEASESGGKPAYLSFAPGTSIAQMEVQDDRLILHLHTPRGDEIDIIDTQSGRLVARGGIESLPRSTK
jgi:hypothetical protein